MQHAGGSTSMMLGPSMTLCYKIVGDLEIDEYTLLWLSMQPPK